MSLTTTNDHYAITDTNTHYSVTDWNDRYAIGIPEVDSRYQYLFFLFNTNSDGFIDYASANDLHTIFDQLVDYARYQFFAEERWMQHHLFPRLKSHENEHGGILTRASDIYQEFSHGIWPLSLEILEVMHLWIKAHILSSNEEIDDFVAANQLHSSPRSSEYKMKTPDTARMALHAWHAYSHQTAIVPASSSQYADKILQSNEWISC